MRARTAFEDRQVLADRIDDYLRAQGDNHRQEQ